ncbi:RNA polymerase sigma factor [Crocinitomicaceae bacterium]|nr:RNA polymerase sigma factor [Crocinitomicaceae bacterium]MDB4324416.1 RNA polymerase sigma factor [Crocinitomicaceae bacterium]
MRLIRRQYNTLTDESLMVSISQGDKKAFDEIYTRYSGPLLGFFINKLWKDREKSEDFVHDIFAKIIKKPESFDPSRKFKTWLYSVANNMCKNEYKKQEVRKDTTSGLDSHYSLKDDSSNVLSEVQDSQFRDEFEVSLHALDIKHKEVFELRHVNGLSIKEIAEVLVISDGTVKSRLFYATKYLSESLKEFNPVLNR